MTGNNDDNASSIFNYEKEEHQDEEIAKWREARPNNSFEKDVFIQHNGQAAYDYMMEQERNLNKTIMEIESGGPITEQQWKEVFNKHPALVRSQDAKRIRNEHKTKLGIMFYKDKK